MQFEYIIRNYFMMARNVLLLYFKGDETKLSDLIQEVSKIKHLTRKNDSQLDENTKQSILECDIFICCLSKEFSESKMVDIVKFAYCIARKRINTIYLEKDKVLFLAKVEDQSFFRLKTVEYSSLDQIKKVNIFYKHFRKYQTLLVHQIQYILEYNYFKCN